MSTDGTADALMHLCSEREIEAFRWNVDLWDRYEVKVNRDAISLRDPTGRICNAWPTSCDLLYRKPFLDATSWTSSRSDRPIFLGQMRGLLRWIVVAASEQGCLKLVEPNAEKRVPKLRQLRDASSYFPIPEYELSTHGPSSLTSPAVTKPLDELITSSGDVLWTTLVDPQSLERPYPWFLQEAVVAGKDVTCVYINGSARFYCCRFERSEESLDWRTEINTGSEAPWSEMHGHKIEEWSALVARLMQDWGLHYGRLDFINADDGTLWFLECNPNGQFGWLDDDQLSLHTAFLEAAMAPETKVSVH